MNYLDELRGYKAKMVSKIIFDDKKFRKSLKKLKGDLSSAIDRGMSKNVAIQKEESQKLAPFKTGELENNVSTQISVGANRTTGEVQYNVKYAAIRHNKLDTKAGPGTAGKAQTQYGTPGPNYLENAARVLGRDAVYHENIQKESKKISSYKPPTIGD